MNVSYYPVLLAVEATGRLACAAGSGLHAGPATHAEVSSGWGPSLDLLDELVASACRLGLAPLCAF